MSAKTRRWLFVTAALILLTPTLLGAYDIAAELIAGNEATFSRLFQETAWEYPPFQWSICEILGAFLGHIFTTKPKLPLIPRWISLIVFIILPFLNVVASFVFKIEAMQNFPSSPLVALLFIIAGFGVGNRLLHQTG